MMKIRSKKSQFTAPRVNFFLRLITPHNKHIAHEKPDYILLGAVALVIFVGLIMLSSATSVLSFKVTSGSYYFFKQQMQHGILPGILFFLIALRINYRSYKKFAPAFLLATLVLLLLVFIPSLGKVENGVRSWIHVGAITIQTSEIAKLTFVVWMASWLASREQSIRNVAKTTLPFFIVVALVCGLILLQPDTGTMMIFAGLSAILFMLAGAHLLHLAAGIAAGILAVVPFILAAPYRLARLLTFWDPGSDTQGAGYQVRQALIALGSGSWWGVGIGQSQQKLSFLPEIESDSIFAIIGEEWGFVFSAALIVLFSFIFIRGIRISRQAPDQMGMLLAAGLIFLITLQVLINIGAIVGLLPLTGIPLPFISLGGTNSIVLLTSLGILCNISMYRQQ